ncbi:MAG: hypothetical protein ACI9S8_000381 [Chlamydiales bacterium]|jgi:hypothetical protein
MLDTNRNMGRNPALSHGRIEGALRSMDGQDGGSIEQMHMMKQMLEMDRKLRSLESTFGTLYSKVAGMSRTVKGLSEEWCQEDESLCHQEKID